MFFALGLSLALSIPGGGANLHPDFSAKVHQLVERSAQAGVRLKVISGYRRMDVAKARTQKRASWHNFGLAIDVNLAKRRDMRDALNHYQRDAKDWQTVARIGREVGLIWGGEWRREEIFHFEWHPGMPSGLRDGTLTTLLHDAGHDGKHFKRTWHRFGNGGAPEVAKRRKRPNERGTKTRGTKKRTKTKVEIAKVKKAVKRPKQRAKKASKSVKRRKRRRG